MGSIYLLSDYCSRDTKNVDFIWCVNGWDPQLPKVWCLSSNNVTCELHLLARVDFDAGTVRHFTIKDLSKMDL